jgi:hypothetical protein
MPGFDQGSAAGFQRRSGKKIRARGSADASTPAHHGN